MKTAKLKSKKKLFFPPFYNGTVEKKIVNVTIDYLEKRYILLIEDSCYKEVDGVTEILGTPVYKTSYQSFDTIKQLYSILKDVVESEELFKSISILLGQGLYHTTKKEIEEENLSWYGSESIDDWELIIE